MGLTSVQLFWRNARKKAPIRPIKTGHFNRAIDDRRGYLSPNFQCTASSINATQIIVRGNCPLPTPFSQIDAKSVSTAHRGENRWERSVDMARQELHRQGA